MGIDEKKRGSRTARSLSDQILVARRLYEKMKEKKTVAYLAIGNPEKA